MNASVYLETSVVSYAASRIATDPIQRAKQLLASRLLQAHKGFDFVVSTMVLDECQQGDNGQAKKRLELIASIERLEFTPEVAYLAKLLIERQALPANSLYDATHIAYAAVHQVDYIASYNFRHIASVFCTAKN